MSWCSDERTGACTAARRGLDVINGPADRWDAARGRAAASDSDARAEAGGAVARGRLGGAAPWAAAPRSASALRSLRCVNRPSLGESSRNTRLPRDQAASGRASSCRGGARHGSRQPQGAALLLSAGEQRLAAGRRAERAARRASGAPEPCVAATVNDAGRASSTCAAAGGSERLRDSACAAVPNDLAGAASASLAL